MVRLVYNVSSPYELSAMGQQTRPTQPFILPGRQMNVNPCKKWVTEANGRRRGRGVVYRHAIECSASSLISRLLHQWTRSAISVMTMRAHIAKTTQTCFFHLIRLRQIRRLLGRDVACTLVSAFVLCRVDYCNAVLSGLPPVSYTHLTLPTIYSV